jgi:hypothetical protein
MKKTLLCNILVVLFLSSCAPTKPFKYVYQMTKPQKSEINKFEDDKVVFEFKMNDADVSFKLSNKTEKPLKIIWDEASFVNQGEAQKVTHKNVKFIDSEKSQAPTVIPPGAYVSEVIQPIDDISLDRNTYTWSKKPFLPPLALSTHKKYVDTKLKPLIGRKFNIYIPVQYEGKTLEYYFEIELSDIRHITKKKNVSIMTE